MYVVILLVLSLTCSCDAVTNSAQARQLTNSIKVASTLPSLLDLHQQQRDRFNHIHLSAFWARAGALGMRSHGTTAEVLRPVIDDTLEMCAEGAFGCRQLTSTSHGRPKTVCRAS